MEKHYNNDINKLFEDEIKLFESDTKKLRAKYQYEKSWYAREKLRLEFKKVAEKCTYLKFLTTTGSHDYQKNWLNYFNDYYDSNSSSKHAY